jgi:hypothetical protein
VETGILSGKGISTADRPLCGDQEHMTPYWLDVRVKSRRARKETMDEAKKDLPAHHYPARRSSQGKRQAPREATEKAADGQGLPAEKPATEPPKPLSRVARGLLLPRRDEG